MDHRVQDLLSKMVGGRRVEQMFVNSAAVSPPNGLLVGSGGLANLYTQNGSIQIGVPLQTGYNPISPTKLGSGTAAANVWGIWEG